MKVETIPVNPFEMNCYIYYDENSQEGVIIDPAAYSDSEKEIISDFLNGKKIKIKYILNTHGHIDHILGNHWAKETFNVPVLIHKSDLSLLNHSAEQGKMFGMLFQDPPQPDRFIDEGDIIEISGASLKVIYTPGHSPGGVCFIDEKEKVMFVGDTIFKNSIGRTDLWEGDMDLLMDSINNKILHFEDDFKIYPGHYDATTIGEERENNPFLK